MFRRQFPKGQGPGEFDSFDPVFSPDGRLFAADWSQRRLTILDLDFKVVQIEKMGLYGDEFQMIRGSTVFPGLSGFEGARTQPRRFDEMRAERGYRQGDRRLRLGSTAGRGRHVRGQSLSDPAQVCARS